jgi:uncharacterized protein (TIGR00369 family)
VDIGNAGWYSVYESTEFEQSISMRRPIVFDNPLNHCFGCGPTNPAGLRLSFVESDEGVEAAYTVPVQLQGAAGIVHGGIQATLLDETLCMTAYAKVGTPVFTGELTVRYLRPVPTGAALHVRGRIVEAKSKGWIIEGEITLAGSAEALTRARGRFFAQPSAGE